MSNIEKLLPSAEKLAKLRDSLQACADSVQEILTYLDAQVGVAPAKKPETPQKAPTDIRQLFPEDLSEQLDFVDEGQHIKIVLKHFLGSDAFARAMAVVRGLGGSYISDGKNSHFDVPKI
jgi:hypothetical protein